MDLSCYYDQMYEEAISKLPQEDKTQMPPIKPAEENTAEKKPAGPIELTDEVNERDFIQWDKNPCFIGAFIGAGPDHTFGGHLIKTWKLQDENNVVKLLPQWPAFSEPQLDFKGFANEDPAGNFLYNINYEGKHANRHTFKIFKKSA